MPSKETNRKRTSTCPATELIKDNLCFFCFIGGEHDDGSSGKMEKSSKIWAHRKCLQYNSRLWQYDDDLGFGGFKVDLVLKVTRVFPLIERFFDFSRLSDCS